MTGAYDLLQNAASDITQYTTGSRFRNRFCFKNQKLQSGKDLVPGTDGKTQAKIQCRLCHKWDHYANQCAHKKLVQFAQVLLAQQGMNLINPDCLLLDSCSTISVCCNPKLVQHIRACAPGDGITVMTNGGSQTFNKVADLNILPVEVHFNQDSLANILALSDVANLPGARITMDTLEERVILLHYNDQIFKFKECVDGLYYYDTSKTKSPVSQYSSASSFVQTVCGNKAFLTKRDIEGADSA